MLQSVLAGNTQGAFSALSPVDSQNIYYNNIIIIYKYSTVNDAGYGLVQEAYRQRFRSWRKFDKQLHVDFHHET